MNWTSDDYIAVVAAPLILFAFVRLLPALHRRVPSWSPVRLVGVWVVVLGALAVLLLLSVTVKAVLVAWIFLALAAVALTRTWIRARRGGPGP